MRFSNLIILSLFVAQSAFAGHEFGNGGGVVVCRRPILKTIKSVELLDFYEARTIRGILTNLGDEKLPWKDQVKTVLERLRPFSELRYQVYNRWLDSFEGEAFFIKDANFTTIEDNAHIAIPKGCSFEQAAVQKVPQFRNDPRYYMNGDLWDHMSDKQKAGLVLHEIIYREALGYGHTFSTDTRYFSAQISSPTLSQMSVVDFLRLLQDVHFEWADIPLGDSNAKVTVDITRVSRVSEYEKAPLPVEMMGRVLMVAGVCKGDDCADYIKSKDLMDALVCKVKGAACGDNRYYGYLSNDVTRFTQNDRVYNLIKCRTDLTVELGYAIFDHYSSLSSLDSIKINSSIPVTPPQCKFRFEITEKDRSSVFNGQSAYGAPTFSGMDLSESSYEMTSGQLGEYISFSDVLARVVVKNNRILNLSVGFVETSDSDVFHQFEFMGFTGVLAKPGIDTKIPENFSAFFDVDHKLARVSPVVFKDQTIGGTMSEFYFTNFCLSRSYCMTLEMVNPPVSTQLQVVATENTRVVFQGGGFVARSGTYLLSDANIPQGLVSDTDVELTDRNQLKVSVKTGQKIFIDKDLKLDHVE